MMSDMRKCNLVTNGHKLLLSLSDLNYELKTYFNKTGWVFIWFQRLGFQNIKLLSPNSNDKYSFDARKDMMTVLTAETLTDCFFFSSLGAIKTHKHTIFLSSPCYLHTGVCILFSHIYYILYYYILLFISLHMIQYFLFV